MTARSRPLLPVVGLGLWAASGCGGPRVTPAPPPNAGAPTADASTVAAAGLTAAAPDTDRGPVRTLYTEAAPFTNKATVEVVAISPACHDALVEVACAPPVLTASRDAPSPTAACPALALDAIDVEHGALLERWIAGQETARYFTRYDDVEGGRPLAPPAGFGEGAGARCDGPHAASTVGAELERAAAHDERRIIDSDDAPEMVVWKRWMKSARDGVPAKIERAELAALQAAAGSAGWSPDRKHLYVSGRWEQSRCLYDLAIEDRAGDTTATRRSFCSKAKDATQTLYALSPDRRSAACLTPSADAPDALPYSVLDLATGQICKKARLDVGPIDARVDPALSDDGILWIAREPPAPPLVADLASGRAAALDSPPRIGVRGVVYAGAPAGPGVARSAAALWIDGSHAVTTRVTDDGRTAVVLVDALALFPEARGRSRDAGCTP